MISAVRRFFCSGPVRAACAVGFLLALNWRMFNDVLRTKRLMLSHVGYDIWAYFFWVRQWGFRQLAAGDLALWNPHILCGVPFFGNFQSALLYPLNWIFLVLPAPLAMNWSIAIHVFLAGLFTWIWCRGRGISNAGSALAGVMFMFCGAYFYKILAGHPTFICAAPWAPIVFFALDRIRSRGQWGGVFLGGAAAAMQMLAGSPQYFYNTALAAGFYTLLNVAFDRKQWRFAFGGLALTYLLAAGLCAWQLLPGMQLADESIRANGIAFEDATYLSMPPAGVMTLLSPFLFAGRQGMMIERGIRQLMLYAGVAGLVLAIYGAVRADRSIRRPAAAMVVVLFILALGHYTPAYRFFYEYLPGFRNFRSVARFGVLMNLFMAFLAGAGLDQLLRKDNRRPLWAPVLAAVAAIAVGGLSLAIYRTASASDGGVWGDVLRLLDSSGQLYKHGMSRVPEMGIGFIYEPARKAAHVARMLKISAATFGACSLLLLASRWWRPAAYGIALLTVGELFVSASYSRAVMVMPLQYPRPWREAIKSLTPEERSFQTRWGMPNRAMVFGTYEVTGSEAAILGRYRTLIQRLKAGHRDEDGDASAPILQYPGICQMLRVKYVLLAKPPRSVQSPRPPMRRLELVDQYQVIQQTGPLLEALKDPQFEPHKRVYLESEPSIRPEAGGAAGSARVERMSSDRIDIAVDAPKNTLLLVTEAYSKGWRASALPGSSQERYEVMPANYLLRAIPLKAGKHRIRLEYRPRGYQVGQAITLGTLAIYPLAGVAALVLRRRRKPENPPVNVSAAAQ